MYTISEVTDGDIGVLVNYVVDEYEIVSGKKAHKSLPVRVKASIRLSDVKYKLCNGAAIIGFFAFDIERDATIIVSSYFVSREYRDKKKVSYLLVQKFTEVIMPYSKAIYIPLHKDMVLDNKICKDNKINLEELKRRVKV